MTLYDLINGLMVLIGWGIFVLMCLSGLFAIVIIAAFVIDKGVDWIESGRSRFPGSGYDRKRNVDL